MDETRRHKRFKLDLAELDGKMFLIDDVEVLDISLGGLSLRTSKALNVGKEYLITLLAQGKSIEIKGIVRESSPAGTEKLTNGETVQIHTAHIRFKDGQTPKILAILASLQHLGKEDAPAADERRLHVRCRFTMPLDTVLSHSPIFSVKKISLSGMLIQSDQMLKANSVIPMNISINGGTIHIRGRIITCEKKFNGHAMYELGVAFMELTESDKAILKRLTDYLEERGL